MIRQAISCDICGTDKQQTNHWFIAFDQGAELRISGFNSKDRFRSGAKHLCGQICLHKLVDEFMARTIARRTPAAESDLQQSAKKPPQSLAGQTAAPPQHISAASPQRTAAGVLDTSLTGSAAHAPVRVGPVACDFNEFESSAVVLPPASEEKKRALPPQPPPVSNPRVLHADAWKREREREQRAANSSRRSIA